MSYAAKHLCDTFQESVWLKECKFQAVVKTPGVCGSCLFCGSDAGWDLTPICAALGGSESHRLPGCRDCPAPSQESQTHRWAADLAQTCPGSHARAAGGVLSASHKTLEASTGEG